MKSSCDFLSSAPGARLASLSFGSSFRLLHGHEEVS